MKNWRAVFALSCGWVASFFIAAMMLLTVADVLLRAATNTPIRGALEIIELLLAASFFLALPAVFLREENIVVDLIDPIAPRSIPLLKRTALAISVFLLVIMAIQGWLAAKDTLAFGDVTSDLSLPKILYWIPVLAGLILSAIAALGMLFQRVRKSDS